ncbi:GTPase Era [candidate division WOR-3 bacterium]|uniref:GTPase Era n=1 Tax=candidate division WOR-3 bacterium TaxID=2052148 RepID=A0A937XF76_UNCW3|nr:GTPase Era [candidate division WOR-3 bacterium]
MINPEQANVGFRSGYVAIVGLPNVGKSTLLNRLTGTHLAAVAPRPQTTRHRILGILNGAGFQAVFLDTPGLLEPRYALQEQMRHQIDIALQDADLVMLVLDAARSDQDATSYTRLLGGRKVVVVLNKVDLVRDKKELLPTAERLADAGFPEVFMVSALKGGGVEDLKAAVATGLPEGQPFYPPDSVADRPEKFFAAELVREAVFNLYGAEIPYSTTVVIDEFKERPGRKDYVLATIFVERESQKAIVIGSGGKALKRVGSRSRREIEAFIGRPVYLELRVKVAEAWRKDERFIRDNIYGRD